MNHIERLKDKLQRKQNEIEVNDTIISTLESEIGRIQRSIINIEYAINDKLLEGKDKPALRRRLKALNDQKQDLIPKLRHYRERRTILRRQFQQLNEEYEDATTDPISVRA